VTANYFWTQLDTALAFMIFLFKKEQRMRIYSHINSQYLSLLFEELDQNFQGCL